MKRSFTIPIWLIVAILGIAGCGELQPTINPPKEIRIGIIAPMSGDFAETAGAMSVNAAKLAVQEVNDAGGIVIGETPYRIQLVVGDDRNEAQPALQAAKKLIEQDDVMAIVGPVSSRAAIAVSEVAEQSGIPMISTAATNPAVTANKRYAFRVAFVDLFQGEVLARFVYQDMKKRRAAILYESGNAYSEGLKEYFQYEFDRLGGQVVAMEGYRTGVQDWSEKLETIRAKNPSVLFLPNYGNDLKLQIKQIRTLGITSTLLGCDSWNYIEPDVFAMPEIQGALYTAHWSPGIANDKAKLFMETYYQAYQEIPNEVSALTYDTLGLLFAVMRNEAQAVDSEVIRNGLANIKEYTGVTGVMQFSGTGDPIRSLVVLQIEQGRPMFYKQVNPE